MRVIDVRNVNHALPAGLAVLKSLGKPRDSRNGAVIEAPSPVTTVFRASTERVLFNSARDCNPFFHLFEALWMLEGRNDVEFLAHLNKRMPEFSDDGTVFHGAYGFRWREWFGVDQIEEIVNLIKADGDTRRAVLTMWSPNGDLVASEGAGGTKMKDIPCNTQVYFKQRDGVLHMTVCNRSNDVLWGTYGANVVHMSLLQEYVACKVGVPVGPYYQISDSYHVYTTGPGGELYWRMVTAPNMPDPYMEGKVTSVPLGAESPDWDYDLHDFFKAWDTRSRGKVIKPEHFRTDWWKGVAVPMWRAWNMRDKRRLHECVATDWKQAAWDWLERREK